MENLRVEFKDPSISETILDKGFHIEPLLTDKEVRELRASYEELKNMAADSIGDQFWPSGRSHNAEIRNFAKDEIEKIIPGRLAEYVNVESTTFIGGTYLVKPPSDISSLDPHQDSSHVDERNGFSVYAWIPLTDTNEKNGWIQYLPGSHKWGIDQRSLNVPWPLADLNKKMWPLMKGIPMKAGQVLFFHSALIHSSPPNLSDTVRVACNYYLHPKESPFCHFYTDPTIPEGKVEIYSVTPDFYYSEDFESKPNADKYPLIDTVDISKFDKQIATALIEEVESN